MADLHEYRGIETHPIAHRTNGQSAEHKTPHANPEQYKQMYEESINDPNAFWDRVSTSSLRWGSGKAKHDPTWPPEPGPEKQQTSLDGY